MNHVLVMLARFCLGYSEMRRSTVSTRCAAHASSSRARSCWGHAAGRPEGSLWPSTRHAPDGGVYSTHAPDGLALTTIHARSASPALPLFRSGPVGKACAHQLPLVRLGALHRPALVGAATGRVCYWLLLVYDSSSSMAPPRLWLLLIYGSSSYKGENRAKGREGTPSWFE